ncbi:deoxyribonuclease-related protein [Colletotrichum tofieldiae]|nr:deoxyribonuclease-related protein [Colletotrichum tofieldiae]
MNTLCNHGFVPHDGRNITLDKLTKGLMDALNIAEFRAINIFEAGLITNPIPNATFFDMQMLHAHNVIEHDGSLSRRDAIFDTTNRFDEETFNNFVSYFGSEHAINTSMIANARARQALDRSWINPTFSITQDQVPVIVGENAMLLAIFGHPENPVANRSFLEYFFRNERLPVEIGWVPVDTPIDVQLAEIVRDIIGQSPPDVPLTFTPQAAA